MIVDLSHPITRDGFVYPGFPSPEIVQFRSHSRKGKPYGPRTSFAMTRVSAVMNIGTYLDSPYHRHEKGADFTGVPLERLVNLPGVVVDARRRPGRKLPVAIFPRHQLTGHAVLILTGWSERWNTPRYTEPGPFVGKEAAAALVEAEPAVVGIDCMNIDDIDDPERPAHTLLLAAGIPICEHMTNLEQLAGKAFRFSAAPPAWERVASFPVRAFAVVE
ncbi:MAG TPA: cyclase family protein [Gemmatimonadales bacterium]|nr:cyclase family protein [Gemmatimonadales bacterium]